MRCYPPLLIFPQFSSKIASRSQFHDGFSPPILLPLELYQNEALSLFGGPEKGMLIQIQKKWQNFLGIDSSKRWTWNWMKLEDVHQREKSFEHAQGGKKMMVAIQIFQGDGSFQSPTKPHEGFFSRESLMRTGWYHNTKPSFNNPQPSPQKKNSNRTYYSTNPKDCTIFHGKTPSKKKNTIQILASSLIQKHNPRPNNACQPTPTPISPHQKWTSIPRYPGLPTNKGTAKVMFLKDGPGHASWRS